MDPNKSVTAPEVIDAHPVTNHSESFSEINKASTFLIKVYENGNKRKTERGRFTRGVVSELAAWYEKLRTAIENRDEEVILRAAIERILRRRLLLGGSGSTVAEPLVRELVWA